jgi:hypothetical protein
VIRDYQIFLSERILLASKTHRVVLPCYLLAHHDLSLALTRVGTCRHYDLKTLSCVSRDLDCGTLLIRDSFLEHGYPGMVFLRNVPLFYPNRSSLPKNVPLGGWTL